VVCICGHLLQEHLPTKVNDVRVLRCVIAGCICANFEPDDKDPVPV
jgi:hypothetical protein